MLYTIYFYILSLIMRIFCRIKVTGAENLPGGSAIICSNHTSLLDPVVIAVAMYRKRRQMMKFMAKKELSRVPVLAWLIKPLVIFVDRGNSDLKAIRDTIELLRKGDKVLVFPEGRRVDVGESAQANRSGTDVDQIGGPAAAGLSHRGEEEPPRFPKLTVSFGKPYHPQRGRPVHSESYRKIADDLMEDTFAER